MNNIDKRLLVYKPISITLNFDWENTTLDQRAQMRWDYIQEQKKKDPNYVGWDFPEHFSSTHGKNNISTELCDKGKLISTIGQIVQFEGTRVKTSFGSRGKKGYLYFSLTEHAKIKRVSSHRVIAATFIPTPSDLSHLKDLLVVNHKNDVKHCNLISNLEWCTNQENQLKSVETGARKTTGFKLLVLLHGPLKNKTYYFNGRADIIKYGFSYPGVITSSNTNTPIGGCLWSKIPKSSLMGVETGIDEIELSHLKARENSRISTNPLLGTIISEGPCKGNRFIIYGPTSLKENGFNKAHPYTVAKGKKPSHRGCTWKHITREEADGFQIGLTSLQKEHLFGKNDNGSRKTN